MSEIETPSTSSTRFSVVIATYNDWAPLNECLRSLAEQKGSETFEVIVVDDGSNDPEPDFIREWNRHFPLTVVRQAHQGISAARNCGVLASRGRIVVFVDADCKLQEDCLAKLAGTIATHPERNYFQLRLIGDCRNLIGRAEELRLIIIQDHMLQTDGCIRYLNTAGFAIRRSMTRMVGGVFDPQARRAEDTLFLANLMQGGELPWFVENAVVQHAIPLTFLQCLVKDVRSAYQEAHTYDRIAARGVKFRISHRDRLKMLREMWQTSARREIGRTAWFVLATRQVLRLVTLLLTDASRLRFGSRPPANPA